MIERRNRAGLSVDARLDDFVSDELLPAAGIDPDTFWTGTANVVAGFGPRIESALQYRDTLQAQLDGWHRHHPGPIADMDGYVKFLEEIGYLLPEPDVADTRIRTDRVDDEISKIAGPQLVVPLTNGRFAANAANARWGSLYDALYGTDAIPREGTLVPGSSFNAVRGAAVIAWARRLLDDAAPLERGSHADATAYAVVDSTLHVSLPDGRTTLRDQHQFVGYRGDPATPTAIVLANRGLHLEILIDRDDPIGASDAAGVRDVVLESAVTTIMDLEDAASAVDAADKVGAYRTWLGLMTGTLEATVLKDERNFVRVLEPDRPHTRADGETAFLPGRSLQFIRHVGHAMFTDAVLDPDGRPIPEGVLDAMHHGGGGAARPARPVQAAELTDRVDVHRQAEDARPRGGGLDCRPVRRARGGVRTPRTHAQARHHGRGTTNDRQPGGLCRGGARPRRLHQHRIPRPNRRRDPHVLRRRPVPAQGAPAIPPVHLRL